MSPEERAKAVIKDLCATDQLLSADGKSSLLESLVATAIRAACNEKLEEAAEVILREMAPKLGASISVGDELLMYGAQWSANRIRSLKDTSP